jgi:hypothetical protein
MTVNLNLLQRLTGIQHAFLGERLGAGGLLEWPLEMNGRYLSANFFSNSFHV